MLVSLSPYLAWLGIMLSSNPFELRNRIKVLSKPLTIATPAPTGTTPPFHLYKFNCSGRKSGRYPHPKSCVLYFMCADESLFVRSSRCPDNLHFSSAAGVCTIPEDAGCTIPSPVPDPEQPTSETPKPGKPTTTPGPDLSTFLGRVSTYHKANDEPHLVIYYDRNVSQHIRWPVTFARTMWDRVLAMYGTFGPNNRLYMVLRGSPLSEELNYSTYLDSRNTNLNTIEVGSDDWSSESPANTDLITLNMAHIVTTSARGVVYPGSEAMWPEIFVYDMYARAPRPSDRDRWAAKVNQDNEGTVASISLFSEWYLPIYQMYGGATILNRYLIERERNFPKSADNPNAFERDMNRGEFVHFWSGSVSYNLTDMANQVFGWNARLREQYEQAVANYTDFTY